MNRIASALCLFSLAACAHTGVRRDDAQLRRQVWSDAHLALQAEQFARADSLFSRLTRDYPTTEAGRESHFYLGTLRLDPRNPGWDPETAETALDRYLSQDSTESAIHRRPEGQTLQQIARQLNMDPEQRIEGLQPETRTVVRRVVVPGREAASLTSEVQRLRRQLAERQGQLEDRDATIRRQNEELERIRKTLTGTRPRR